MRIEITNTGTVKIDGKEVGNISVQNDLGPHSDLIKINYELQKLNNFARDVCYFLELVRTNEKLPAKVRLLAANLLIDYPM